MPQNIFSDGSTGYRAVAQKPKICPWGGLSFLGKPPRIASENDQTEAVLARFAVTWRAC